jgi:hypothetical protein
VRQAVETLGRDRILGVVLNGTVEAAVSPDFEHYAAYGPSSAEPAALGLLSASKAQVTK